MDKTGGDKHTIKRLTETTGTTDGKTWKTGGDKTGVDRPSNETIETTATTDGKTGGDKHAIKKTETTGTTDGKTWR